MQPERFTKTKSVMASSVIALVVAALVFGASTLVLGPRPASSENPGFALTSGLSSFTITSTVYPSPACSGSTALVYPGTPRCVIFSVHNNLSVPISVQNITSALDTTDYPAPPAVCAGSYLTFPTYSGSFTVPASGNASSPGVTIELKDSGSSQDGCAGYTYHFTYSGGAEYTDSTSTTLSAGPNPSTSGQSVSFSATVTAANASTDPTLPSGTVSFYRCPTSAQCTAGSSNLLGSGTISTGGKASFSASTLSAGTTYVEAVYPASGTNFTPSTSNVVAQVVGSSTVGTSTSVTSSPDPSGDGQATTLTATVTKFSGAGTPTGTVTFHLGSPSGTVLGSAVLTSIGQANLITSTLPAGTDSVFAVYSGDSHFSGSTSSVRVLAVIGLPTKCTASYPNFFDGATNFPLIGGTNGDDFIYAFGGSYLINGFSGNDCIDVGDGNNWIGDGNGNDVLVVGNGSNAVSVGNGNDTVTVGNGSDAISLGNGSDSVIVGNGWHNLVTVGNGTDTISIGTGADNVVNLGNGSDTVTIASPAALAPVHDMVYGGAGNDTFYLGAGSYNTVLGGRGHNTCHLPKPPASWHGAVAAYYHDTITNCTVVTP